MRGILLAFLLAFSVTSYAEFLEPPAYGACRNNLNQPVEYITLPSHVFRMMYPRTEFATTGSKPWPHIILDGGALANQSPEFQEMVHWHECGHHALGHLSRPRGPAYGPSNRSRNEDDADCWAARMMPMEELRIAAEDLKASGMGASPTHRPAEARAERILSCPR